MADPQSSPRAPPPPLAGSNSKMLYYGLVVVATAAVVLVLYNIVIVRWCADQRPPQRIRHRRPRQAAAWRIGNSLAISVASFKYEGGGKGQDGGGDSECAVCLSVFEQGEEIKQLPNCKHCFHAPCIDMWLYSHMDCPLCRSLVEPIHRPAAAAEETEHSREVLLGPGSLV
ncbi:RING-type E3 ubiquitin transferase [Salvia divinorum]|uniref:RING-type E3 ubiquitin transferase n=1 Tax=Salvia divinorum TaxID=28513 RepID=A0ABD1GYG0_SALDI